MIVDPHIHTKFSPCSRIGLKELYITAIDRNIDALIITDHNVMNKEVLKQFPEEYEGYLKVFLGEEISTIKGDILAYDITDTIPKGLTPEKTIEMIHDQGGLAVAAHPYRKLGKSNHYDLIGLGDEIFNLDLDAIEGVNGGNRKEFNSLAIKAGKTLNLPIMGGSDAHDKEDIGLITMEMPKFDTLLEFADLIKSKKFRINYNVKSL
jgi:hypothetical protein